MGDPLIGVPPPPVAAGTKQAMQPVAPITVSVIGNTGTGNGTTPTGTLLTTPDGQPNWRVNVVDPTIAVLVRFVNLFLTTFLSLGTAAGLGSKMFAATDLKGILVTCAWSSLIVAGVGTVKNLVTVFGRLEGKYPLATGSI